MEYFENKLWSNNDTCTSKYSSEIRNRGIDMVYVGVELPYKHTRTTNRFFTKKFSTT